MPVGELGIRLVLRMGPVIPLPVPDVISRALDSIEVTNDNETGDGFQMTFVVIKDKLLDYTLLTNVFNPGFRVAIGVELGASTEVLIDGVIEHHQVQPGQGADGARLTVTGKDISSLLDREERNESYENQPDFVIVLQALARYPQLGFVPLVMPTTEVPLSTDRIPRQAETDLTFIKRLASRNGFVFFIESGPIGVNKAYWGPDYRSLDPQPALTKDLGPSSNLSSLNFSNDSLAPVAAQGVFIDPIFKMSIPIPQLPSLKLPPRAADIQSALRTVKLRDASNKTVGQAATSALAASEGAAAVVSGEGELDTAKYGHVLRARRPVGLRGAGLSYDGYYNVQAVTHQIARGEYKQRFRISREGLGTTTQVLPI